MTTDYYKLQPDHNFSSKKPLVVSVTYSMIFLIAQIVIRSFDRLKYFQVNEYEDSPKTTDVFYDLRMGRIQITFLAAYEQQ